jgi:hypothetical protein
MVTRVLQQLKQRVYSRCAAFGWSPKRTTYTLAATAVIVLLLPVPAAAIFGLGDVVFDPSSYAELGHIWSENISTYAKITAELEQLQQIYSNAQAMYNQAMAMARRIQSLKRMRWSTLEASFISDATQNRYGETASWPITVNGSSPFAKAAWKTATLFLNSNTDTFLRTELLGNSGLLSNLASIEEQDGSASKCLGTIAEYRTAVNENQSAIDALQSDGDDAEDDDANSEIGQLNLVNGAQAAALHEQRSQGALHACLVEQNIISNSWQRNAAAESMNIFGAAQSSRNGGQSDYGGVSSNYYSYVPQ